MNCLNLQGGLGRGSFLIRSLSLSCFFFCCMFISMLLLPFLHQHLLGFLTSVKCLNLQCSFGCDSFLFFSLLFCCICSFFFCILSVGCFFCSHIPHCLHQQLLGFLLSFLFLLFFSLLCSELNFSLQCSLLFEEFLKNLGSWGLLGSGACASRSGTGSCSFICSCDDRCELFQHFVSITLF